MARFLGLEWNPFGTKTEYHKEDGKLVINEVQDVEPVLEANKRAQANRCDYRPHAKGEMHKVASVPLVIVQKWLNEGIDVFNKDHWPKVKAKLNDPEYRFLRTTPGRI